LKKSESINAAEYHLTQTTMTREELLYMVSKIKQARKKMGITQLQFYCDTGINVARIESLKRVPCIVTLQRICKYLNMNIYDVLKN